MLKIQYIAPLYLGLSYNDGRLLFQIIIMYNDIEDVITDNLSIKKAYYLSKSHADKLTQEVLTLQETISQLNIKIDDLNDRNAELSSKNKRMQMDLANDTASFVSQIEQLKFLIQQKEEELANFQLKLIPSLDQDMLKVKLIAEMEGPYQEAVEKKERENQRLKDQIHTLKREKQILAFSLANKERDCKRELSDLKAYYSSENESLSRQLAHFASKQNCGRLDKDLLTSYRKQIDEMRATSEFQKSLEEELRKQIYNLKLERSKLMEELAQSHISKASTVCPLNHEEQIKALKQTRDRQEQEINSLRASNQRLQKKYKSMESDKIKTVSRMEADMQELKQSWEKQRQSRRTQNNDHEQQIRRLKDLKNRQEQEYRLISQKYQSLQISNNSVIEQNRNLKVRIEIAEQSIQSSRFKRSEQTERVMRERIEREVKEHLEKEIRQKIILEFNSKDPRRENDSPNKDDDEWKKTSKPEQKLKKMQQKNRRLTAKLEFANRKILELLRQKGQRADRHPFSQEQPQRDIHSVHRESHRILLENRDCSFIPLMPPVIYDDRSYL